MATVSSVFITQWGQEFAYKYQQKDSRLRDSIRTVTGVGSSYSFPRMELSNAVLVSKSRHADVSPANVDQDRVSATPVTLHWAEYLDDLDAVRTNADVRNAFTDMGVAAINRQVDTQIIAALAAGGTSATSSLTTANTLNSGGLLAIAQLMNANDVDFGDRYAAVSAGAINNLMSDTKFTSRDYVGQKYLESGSIPGVLGFHMNFTNLLTVPSGVLKRNFFYHKNPVGLHVVKDLTMRIDFVPQKDSFQVMVKCLLGAIVIRPEAVFYADITG